MNAYKKRFFQVVVLYLLGLSLTALVIFVIDPYQRYRKPFYGKTVHLASVQYTAGILAKYRFDSLIIGDSMAQNLEVTAANQLFGGKFINASKGGASGFYCKKVLKYANSIKRSKIVIASLDIDSFVATSEKPDELKYDFTFKPYSLSREIQYLLNFDTFKQVLKLIEKKRLDVYELNSWKSDYVNCYGERFVQKSLTKSLSIDTSIADLERNFSETFRDMIVSNSDQDFVLYFPPYSKLFYSHRSESDFKKYCEIKKAIIKSLLSLKNVKVYDFQDRFEITTNLDNYKDYSHFSPEISSLILKDMASGRGMLKMTNYQQKLDNLRYYRE